MQQLLIDGELTIYNATEQKTALLNFLNSGDQLEIDLSLVSELDTAGLQLLVLIKREAAKLGKDLRFVMHSKIVQEVLELTNLGV
jgi:anti-anti-sigma factor